MEAPRFGQNSIIAIILPWSGKLAPALSAEGVCYGFFANEVAFRSRKADPSPLKGFGMTISWVGRKRWFRSPAQLVFDAKSKIRCGERSFAAVLARLYNWGFRTRARTA